MLPEAFARDPERMARFEREARVLASLNHPGIFFVGLKNENEDEIASRNLVLNWTEVLKQKVSVAR